MRGMFKIMLVLIGIAALSLSEISLMFWLGGNDVKKFCNEIKHGLPIAQLGDLAKRYDVRYRLPGSCEASGLCRVYVNTPRSFGRHVCMVQHDNDRVIGSQYIYAD